MADPPSIIDHPSSQEGEAADLIKRMVKRNPLVWLCNFTRILIKAQLSRFNSNVLQRRFVEVVLFCLARKLPIRIICLKPRRKGISTISVGCMAWLLMMRRGRAMIIGLKGKVTDNLWTMLRRFFDEDTFPWGIGKPRIGDEKAEFANGSTATKESALAESPGRSDGVEYMVCTELAYWGQDGKVKNASAVWAGITVCVEDNPWTYIVGESTSAGPAGLFYRQWQEAVTFEEFKAHPTQHAGKFVRVFAGWHEFPDSQMACKDKAEEAAIMDGIGALNSAEYQREKELVRRYGLTPQQIKWWRLRLTKADNDPAKRDLDFPAEPDDAFRAGQLCRFNWAGLKRLQDEAAQGLNTLQFGHFHRSMEGQVFPDWRTLGCSLDGHGDVCIAEHPKAGMQYILVVDTSKGIAAGEDRRDLDCHAVAVIREGYFSEDGQWIRPKAVACLMGPRRRLGGLIRPEARWEPYELSDRIHDLSLWYGKCKIVVENNNDPGILPRLKHMGANLYEEVYDEKDLAHAGQSKRKLGFTMGDNSARSGVRSTIIADLAQAVAEVATRGNGIEIPFPWILDEMEHFVNDPDTGRAEAASGWHDDWVMMLAIARACKAAATHYIAPLVAHRMPGMFDEPQTNQMLAGQQGVLGGSGYGL